MHSTSFCKQEAKEKFQMLQKVYGILGDPDKRKAYDECGILEDDVKITFSAPSDLLIVISVITYGYLFTLGPGKWWF